MRHDLVVLGSGGAGLTAALSAARRGASVVVLERSGHIGGTTAVSGGGMWIPRNPFMVDMGVEDTRADALAYVTRLALGRSSDEVLETFVDESPRLFRFLAEQTAMPLEPAATPDYQSHLPGARSAGRQIAVGLYDTSRLGDLARLVRSSPWRVDAHGSAQSNPPLRHEEQEQAGWGTDPEGRARLWDLAMQRSEQGVVGRGRAMVAALLEACAQSGVEFATGVRGRDLIVDQGRVVGVHATREGRPVDYVATQGVVLATGGFEWNQDLVRAFIGVPLRPLSPPLHEGDGLLMASRLGARLGVMNQAWWASTVRVPGERLDGAPAVRWSAGRALPGMLIVNQRGRRFANESLNYNDFSHAMANYDPQEAGLGNNPAYVVVDAAYQDRYPLINYWELDTADPAGWLMVADTLPELAEAIGVDRDGLLDQVRDFNEHAALGLDPQFGRGQGALDRYRGDPSARNPNLGPLGDGPYAAYRIELGCLGTKGGPLTDHLSRVVDHRGAPIPGLAAAGNAAASIFGPGYPGGGATLGPGLTFAMIAGETLTSS